MPTAIRKSREMTAMRESCAIAATVLEQLCGMVKPGVSTYDLDQAGKELIKGFGARSACHNYKVGRRRYPGYICISVNDEVVHGIGSSERILIEGDIASVDVVVYYNGFIGDNCRTVAVGKASPQVELLLQATERSLFLAIEKARVGNRVGDLSSTVQQFIESRGFSVVREFVGHGVGRTMHEEPQLPNYGVAGTGAHFREGMTLAIEPMVNMGQPDIRMLDDGWTAVTRDGLPSAHFEHTVLVTDGEPEILTVAKK